LRQFPQSDKQEGWITIFLIATTKPFKLLKALARWRKKLLTWDMNVCGNFG